MDQTTFGNIGDGRQVVATPGTAVRLSATRTTTGKVEVTALPSNTGTIAVGSATVSAVLAVSRGILLAPGARALIYVEDLSQIYIDATVGGEGVTFAYFF